MTQVKTLLELVMEAEYVHPFPDYTGLILWFGGHKLYAFSSTGQAIGECTVRHLSLQGVKDTCKLVIQKLIERGLIKG